LKLPDFLRIRKPSAAERQPEPAPANPRKTIRQRTSWKVVAVDGRWSFTASPIRKSKPQRDLERAAAVRKRAAV
jgi:hypothetical protein